MSSDSEPDSPTHNNRESSNTNLDVSMLENDDPDTLRIMISTDNHLGYAERDSVRGMDSFAAFEEVLYNAKRYNCDMVLIAGDLFHDNRPSRRTLHKTMEIFRRYCMGPDPVKIELLSDAKEQFRSAVSGTVNYQDPNYAVQLPIFSIHGNHDDPSRDQGGGELLAALDLLAVSNLVNYFGRQDAVDKVEISPVLLQKGETRVAIYGLGSLRDERLNRMWERQKVRFQRPEVEDEDEDFFNIFALHQNRDLGRGSKNCIQESMIPEWMDLVVWGHEHECLIEFFESVVGTFRITQPGSSVATSLVSGEAARKKIGVLDIRGKNFRLHPVPLTQVRSFVTTEISLKEHRAELDPEDPKIDIKVTAVLEEEVQLMVANARDRAKETLAEARKAGNNAGDDDSPIKYKLQRPSEVLVRIRVEHSGFSTINNQRFGARFVGDVANPSDMLLFHRKKDPKLASTIKKKGIQPIAPEELERTNMEDLVHEHLAIPESKLKLLGEKSLSEALEDYVDKSQTSAISETAGKMLNDTQKTLIKRESEGTKESQVMDFLDRETSQVDVLMEEQQQSEKNTSKSRTQTTNKKANRKQRPGGKENSPEDEFDDDDSENEGPPARKRKVNASQKSRTKRPADSFTADDSDVSLDDDVRAKGKSAKASSETKSPTRPRRNAAKRKATYTLDESDDDEESDAIVVDEDDEDLMVDDEKPKQKTQRKRGNVTSGRKKAVTSGTARRPQGRKPSRRKSFDEDSDDDIEYIGKSGDIDADWGSAITETQRNRRWK